MIDTAPTRHATDLPAPTPETDFLVVVGYRRSTLDGRAETFAKAVHVRSRDSVSAGERVLDDLISGPRYAFTSTHARVLDRRTGVALIEVHVADSKAFGVRRAATRGRWRPPSGPQAVDVRDGDA